MRLLTETRHLGARWNVRSVAAAVAAALLLLVGTRSVLAESVMVPAELQAELLSKLISYDRNFPARAASGTAVVLLVVKSNSKSGLAATAMKSVLAEIKLLGGLPHRETIVQFESPADLAKLCKKERAAVVYITPGFDDDIDALRSALTGVDVLSVGASADYVARGVVLGFEVVSGKPRLVLNLNQAKQQNVNFKADVLRLMRVYR
jgi:hypothetical protein